MEQFRLTLTSTDCKSESQYYNDWEAGMVFHSSYEDVMTLSGSLSRVILVDGKPAKAEWFIIENASDDKTTYPDLTDVDHKLLKKYCAMVKKGMYTNTVVEGSQYSINDNCFKRDNIVLISVEQSLSISWCIDNDKILIDSLAELLRLTLPTDIPQYIRTRVNGGTLFTNGFSDFIRTLRRTSGLETSVNELMKANNKYVHPSRMHSLSLSSEGDKVEFLPNSTATAKQSMKIGRLFKALGISTELVSASTIEQMVNKIKAMNAPGVFDIVKGEDIRHWYLGERYSTTDNTETLENSCMRSRYCQDFFNIYVENKNCNMLILKNGEGMLVGRALLWTTTKGIRVLDRIYGNAITVQKFVKWASENDVYSKLHQNYESYDKWVAPDGEVLREHLTIELEHTSFNTYPYMDTFCYISDGSCTSSCDSDYNTCARETDGGGGDDGRVYDEQSGDMIDEDDAVYVDRISGYTHVDNTVYTVDSDYELADDCTQLPNGDWVYSDDVVELHDGDMAHIDDACHVDHNDAYALPEDIGCCEHSDTEYINGESTVFFLEDLGITVLEEYVDDAYTDNGYVKNEDDEWVLEEELTEVK